MANATANQKTIIKLKLVGVKEVAKSLSEAGLIKQPEKVLKDYDNFCEFLANVLSTKGSEQKAAIKLAKDRNFVTGTPNAEQFIEAVKAASGSSQAARKLAVEMEKVNGPDDDLKAAAPGQKWAGLAGMVQDVLEAHKGKDVGTKTTTKIGATFARKMFSIHKDRVWKAFEAKLKEYDIKASAEKLSDMTDVKLMAALIDEEKTIEFAKYIKNLLKAYKHAADLAEKKGKEYDAISSGTAFLTKEQIDSHLVKFENGLGAFISEKAEGKINHFSSWGRNNNYVTTKANIETILTKANAESKANAETTTFGVLEKELGFAENQLKGECPGGTFRIYEISKEQLAGKLNEILRLPEATDDSAFAEEWIAGGLTLGGNPEGVIGAISKTADKVSGISPFDQMVTVTKYNVLEDGTWSRS